MAIDRLDYQQAFATIFTHTEELLINAKQHSNALRQYLDSWVEIAEKAAEVDNLALQDVILLFVDGSSAVFKKNQSAEELTEAQWQCLKKWNHAFADYINNPADKTAALALIHCLSNPILAMNLEENDEQLLFNSFAPALKQLNAHQQVNNETIVTISEPVSIWQKLVIPFTAVFSSLQELFPTQNALDNKSYTERVKQYLADWKIIANIVNTENNPDLATLSNILSLFIDLNCQLFNQSNLPTAEQQELIQKWHSLFGHCLKANGSQQITASLIKCLTHSLWPQPLSSEDEKRLLKNIGIVDLPTKQPTQLALSPQTPLALIHQKLLTLPAVVEIDSVWQKITKLFIPAVSALKVMAENPTEAVFSTQVQHYQQLWQQIAAVIESAGQAGLLDVVLLFTEISSPAFELDKLNPQHLARLKKWHGLFDHYVKSKGDKQFVLPLIKCLSDPIWPDAITVEDENMLLDGFDENNKSANVMPIMAEQAGSVIVESNSLTNNLEQIPELEPIIKSSDKAIVVENTTETATISANHQIAEDSIWIKLEKLFNQTATDLNHITEYQLAQDIAALGISLQQYLESWLVIAQEIEINQPESGLLNVVLIFIEITRQAFGQPSLLDKKQLVLLNKWQYLFSRYLKVEGSQQLAWSLIKCLSDPVWSGAITVEDEKMLLADFSAPQLLNLTTTTEQATSEPIITQPAVELNDSRRLVTEVKNTIADESTVEIAITENKPVSFTSVVEAEVELESNTIWQNCKAEFNQAAIFLQTAVDDEIANDTAACKHNLQSYVQSWQTICEIIANDESQIGLMDIVMLFAELANQEFSNSDHLSSAQFSLLNQWQNLFADYLKTPNNRTVALELIQCLSNPLWSEAIESADVQMLLAGLAIAEPESALAITDSDAELIIDVAEEARAEKNPVWQKFELFFADTLPQIQAMQSLLAIHNTRACREHLQQYAQQWLVIAEIIAEEHDCSPVFVDLCFLFADNCMELIEQSTAVTENHLPLK